MGLAAVVAHPSKTAKGGAAAIVSLNDKLRHYPPNAVR